VTSTALMANMPAAESACAALPATPHLEVGLHFNLTEGEPLTSARSLRGRDGHFRPLKGQLSAFAFGRADAGEVEAEFLAQVERARSFGCEPSHLNGHEHIHLFGAARMVVLAFARRRGISVRRPREPLCGDLGGSLGYLARRVVLRAGSRGGDWSGVPYADHFLELTGPRRGRSADWLVNKLARLSGVIEILCHPGESPTDFADPLAERRPAESAILTTPGLRERLREAHVDLTTFGQEFGDGGRPRPRVKLPAPNGAGAA
jgi:predicted glycoside hydrolase/deacetylase ChbG (UPF0249 family)